MLGKSIIRQIHSIYLKCVLCVSLEGAATCASTQQAWDLSWGLLWLSCTYFTLNSRLWASLRCLALQMHNWRTKRRKTMLLWNIGTTIRPKNFWVCGDQSRRVQTCSTAASLIHYQCPNRYAFCVSWNLLMLEKKVPLEQLLILGYLISRIG